ncbi:MAG TPA: hypothetical protein VGL81_29225 [Polyangiaceae bacterium]
MLKDQVLPALTYAAYAAGWRYAPRILATVERVGHRARDRSLDVHALGGLIDGAPIAVRVVAWDAALRAEILWRVSRHVSGAKVAREGSLRASALEPSLRGADMTFIEVPHFRSAPFVDAGFLVVPKRVAHVERLDRVDPPLVRRMRRCMLERGMRATLTRDPRALALFARDLYRPFVLARHAARARPTPTLVLELILARGALIEVREGNAVVGGALIAPDLMDPQSMEIVIIAARDADDEVARTAPVVFAREEARRRGMRRCNHLGSAPFVRDGIFRRKQRYGTIACDMSHRHDRIVFHAAATVAAQSFLDAEPFLVLDRGELVDVRRRWRSEAT